MLLSAVVWAVGIRMVVLAWAVVGSVLAILAGSVFCGLTAYFTKGVRFGRRKVVILAALFPFASLVWAGFVFGVQATVNQSLLHRDPGAGDMWKCPLPNGYSIMMIDETDVGWLYNPETQKFGDSVSEQQDALYGVRELQIVGRYILAGVDTNVSEESLNAKNARPVYHTNAYVLMDTQSGVRADFSSYAELRKAVAKDDIQPDLKPIAIVYSKYRFTWFEVIVIILLFTPPLIGLAGMVRWVLRLRRSQLNTDGPGLSNPALIL